MLTNVLIVAATVALVLVGSTPAPATPPASPPTNALAIPATSAPCPAPDASDAVHVDPTATDSSETTGARGMRVHIDEHGRPMTPPPSSAPVAGDASFRTAVTAAPLVERDAPGGGTGIDLDERYHLQNVARIGADGQVVVDCAAPSGRFQRGSTATVTAGAR
jgi:hypothetical protein